jgi:TP901 family phage tail tape measure protein
VALSIGELIGYVRLDTSGVQRGVAQTERGLGSVRGAVKGVGVALGGIAVGSAIKDSVSLEAAYSKTMAQMKAATGATGSEMGKLNKLAMKLGAETSFSASDAAGAMLELAKAGVHTSDIMGGALAGTLTLAAAGDTDLATASTIAANAMNTFGLKGNQMNKVAAALAGGANASSASVESLGQALSQVGPGATNAGLSLQETVATLAAFDSAGIKGSDAGTSLKTMLAALVPQTDKAKAAMEKYNLKFVDAHGNFRSISNIAQQLRKGLGGLSEAQRTQALTTIFGSDASRAATVLMKNGAKGIQGYIKATNDQAAAQKMAKANMSGTTGALERMHGAIETAELALGQFLAPTVTKLAGLIGVLAGWLTKATEVMGKHTHIVKGVAIALAALTLVVYAHSTAMAVSAAGGMVQWLAQVRIISGAIKVWTAVQWLLNAAMSANPIALVVIAVVALVAAFVIAWKKSEKFREVVTKAWDAVKSAIVTGAQAVLNFLRNHWPIILAVLTGPIGVAVLLIVKHWDRIKSAGTTMVNWVKGIPGKLGALAGKFSSAGRSLIQAFVNGMKHAAGIVSGIAGNVWDSVKGLLNGAIDKINASLEFKISLPGPDIHVNPPNIPHLATGGRAFGGQLAVIGEGREPETVLPDSLLRGLLEKAHAAGVSQGRNSGRSGPLIGQVNTLPGQDERQIAENLWWLTQTRG